MMMWDNITGRYFEFKKRKRLPCDDGAIGGEETPFIGEIEEEFIAVGDRIDQIDIEGVRGIRLLEGIA